MKIDSDTRVLLLKYCRKYAAYKKWYAAERKRLTSLSAQQYSDMPHGTDVRLPTEEVILLLEKLESTHKVKVVHAIDEAMKILPDSLKKPIWNSCLNGRLYTYEYFSDLYYSRSSFYWYKKKFLHTVKTLLDI